MTEPHDLKDLRAFCFVVDLGSITAAAKAMGETKGSVSRRLTRLERSLDVVLLRRSPRLVAPTEDGAEYRARIGKALDLLDDADATLTQSKVAPRGHVRITMPIDVGLGLGAAILARFVDKFPDVSVESILTDDVLDFDAHQIDLALRATSVGLKDSSLVAHKLLDVDGQLFAAPSYLKRAGIPKRPEDLSQHRIVAVRARRGAATITLRKGKNGAPFDVPIHAALTATDYAFAQRAAVEGAGITTIPEVLARADVDAGLLAPVLPQWFVFPGTLYMVHHGTRFLPPKVRAVREHFVAWCAEATRGGAS